MPQQSRLSRLRAALAERSLDAFVILDRTNTLYLTGFKASYSMIIVDAEEARFLTDFRYAEAAEKALPEEFRVLVQPTREVRTFLEAEYRRKGYKNVGFEGTISFDQHTQLKGFLKGSKLKAAGDILTALRRVKDEDEVRSIRKAVKLADTMMAAAIALLKPGITEAEISRRVRFSAEELGGEGESFDNIIASGANSSRPHHRPTDRKLRKGDPVTIDLGAIVKGYCSDLTRTPVLGKPSKKFEEIYHVCLEANEAAIRGARPGMTGLQVDAIAREVIESKGFGAFFGHGLGHGVGLEIHEAPTLNARSKDYRLEPGNIITIEPGIYLPGQCGVRIEDYALVTETGVQVLSRAPKDLLVIPA